MKRATKIGIGVVAAFAVAWFAWLSKVPEIRTTGKVLKHRDTIIESPMNMTAVAATPPALNFTYQGNLAIPVYTDGDAVRDGTAGGTLLRPTGRYAFYRFRDRIIVHRDTFWHKLWPFKHRGVDLYDESVSDLHIPTGFDSAEAFDLGYGDLEGNVVVAATTSIRGGPPKKRLYRISVREIEKKLDE